MDPKPVCKYGATCYRKNPAHLKQFAHPSKEQDEKRAKPKVVRNFAGQTFL